MIAPLVYNFENPIEFLKATLNFLKAQNPKYSVRKWAQDMGMRNPLKLVSILSGKDKLRSKHLSFIGQGLKLDNSERLYFLALILRSQSETSMEKTLYNLLLNHLAPTDQVSTVKIVRATAGDFMQHWVDTVILELSKLKGFPLTPENIQKKLKHDTDVDMIRERIEKLRLTNLLSEKNGKWEKSADIVTTDNDVQNRNAREYIKQVNLFASDALELPMEQREFQCLSVGIKHDEIQEFKEIIRNCRNQIEKLSTDKGDCIYQANLSFFPLTDII